MTVQLNKGKKIDNGQDFASFQLLVDFFEVLEKEMKDSKGEKDVPDSLRGEAVFACFSAYNQRMLGTDWDEDDLSDYGKLIAEAKKLAAKTQTNIITEPAGGPPAWQTATTNNITQTKKAAVVKQEAAFIGGAGFPPRGRNRGRGRGRGSSGAGRGGGHGGQERGQEMNPNDCPKCSRAGGHDPEWLEKNDCPGKIHTCEICGKYGHRPRVCRKKGHTANTPLASTSNSRGRGGPHSQRGRGGMRAARGSGPGRFDGKAAYYAQHEKNGQGCTPDQYEGAEGGIRQTSHTTFRKRDGAPQPFFVDVEEHHACMVDSTGDDAGPPDNVWAVGLRTIGFEELRAEHRRFGHVSRDKLEPTLACRGMQARSEDWKRLEIECRLCPLKNATIPTLAPVPTRHEDAGGPFDIMQIDHWFPNDDEVAGPHKCCMRVIDEWGGLDLDYPLRS
uniref:Uncharacterized protein n=1 Tax=Chromera velia CCMP2878 TaxID=1169474 RepID=A0A0G4GNK6_9ALVE|eukprot:Cvel_4953.t1-p1 / transcript=Cvel_4953.t1 / gene=Cvel_4953 / organism=Chromera_velia_CCMP2878 / gene_product=hypothetical protein / transcript_product=hypothetical protein / location=Cvel_scaffold224:11646-17266(-) / protein_length=444 / sequence_SO=supercontig / SO=protein_coding / is_pseudo=false